LLEKTVKRKPRLLGKKNHMTSEIGSYC